MSARFPTWSVQIRRGRRSLAAATVVAKPTGVQIDTDFPVLTYESETLAGMLLAVAYQVTEHKTRRKLLEPALSAYGWKTPFPTAMQVVEVVRDPEEDVSSDIPF